MLRKKDRSQTNVEEKEASLNVEEKSERIMKTYDNLSES
jgi:hypothetical protein